MKGVGNLNLRFSSDVDYFILTIDRVIVTDGIVANDR